MVRRRFVAEVLRAGPPERKRKPRVLPARLPGNERPTTRRRKETLPRREGPRGCRRGSSAYGRNLT